MSKHLLEVGILKGVGQFGPKFQVEGIISHQPFLMSQKVHVSIEFGLKFCSFCYNSS